MMNTKRCCGYKKHWECENEYPDHMVPVEEFGPDSSSSNGTRSSCRRCKRYFDSIRNPKRKLWYNLAGGQKKYSALSKEERYKLRERVHNSERRINGNAVDVTPRFKAEFGQSTPMTKRETTVVEGEQVPEGWVYVVYNPDVPSVLKIGKTFPDGIPSIMSSARRFGRAELADKFWFDEAYKAEQAIHTVLSDCNLRALGYSDCGVELFKCNLNDVRGAIEIEANNIK